MDQIYTGLLIIALVSFTKTAQTPVADGLLFLGRRMHGVLGNDGLLSAWCELKEPVMARIGRTQTIDFEGNEDPLFSPSV